MINNDENVSDSVRENNPEPTHFLWVDDLRPAPAGWVWAKNHWEAIVLLQKTDWDVVSLDHDLTSWHNETMNHGGDIEYERKRGSQEKTGYHVAQWMVENQRFPSKVRVHTMNPVGGQNMMQLLQRYHPGGAGAVERVSPY